MTLKNGIVYPGSVFNLTLELADELTGDPIDPATLQLLTIDPTGLKVTYTWQTDVPAVIVRLAAGSFYAPVVPDKSGRWHYRWLATTPTFADEGSFNVRYSPFVDRWGSSPSATDPLLWPGDA